MRSSHNAPLSPNGGSHRGPDLQQYRKPMDPDEEHDIYEHDSYDEQDQEYYDEQEEEYYEDQEEEEEEEWTPAYDSHHLQYNQARPIAFSAPEGMEGEEMSKHEDLGYPLGEDERGQDEEDVIGGDDAVLDLVELEQLQEEAERMKGLGNKHMAAQEYTRAYNAYSAALQLSPVGPSSHVFLSNRAASLLSLKRYSAAAVDARRAVALAPTFGKAHARLGQALYFLKQYRGAVEAYEDALQYDEEGGSNDAVTRAYLQKAKEKMARQEEKERRKQMGGGGDDGITVGEESAFQTVAYSIATDKVGVGLASGMLTNDRITAAANSTGGNLLSFKDMSIDEIKEENCLGESPLDESLRRSTPTIMTVETGPMGGPAQRRVDPPKHRTLDSEFPPYNDDDNVEPDPDFDEALRLQRRGTRFLSHKHYKSAVDEFSAALFLVPDDPILTPQLHVGRAHALNGQERFESAKNDALMALRHILRNGDENISAAEAYSVLGKSLYYSKDYQGAMEALEECERVLKLNGGKLSVFDDAYLEQCHMALDAGLGVDHSDGMSAEGGASVVSNGVKSVVSTLKEGKPLTNIPKLKPPRFVSRQDALHTTPNIPPMPKSWPQQSPSSPSSIATGPERTVTFLSDAMGIKLNRGNDGLIRVISVANLPPGSPILRKGKIESGDLVREAGGVDLRRPITATMWGDTVALIKMAPRPIKIIVAAEITPDLAAGSPRSPSHKFNYPSPASSDELVSEFMAALDEPDVSWEDMLRRMGIQPPSAALGEEAVETIPRNNTDVHEAEENDPESDGKEDAIEIREHLETFEEASLKDEDKIADENATIYQNDNEGDYTIEAETDQPSQFSIEDGSHEIEKHDEIPSLPKEQHFEKAECTKPPCLGRQILFDDSRAAFQALNDEPDEAKNNIQGHINKCWIAREPELIFSGLLSRELYEKKLFWSTERYEKRTLAIFRLQTKPSSSVDTGQSSSSCASTVHVLIMLLLREPQNADEVCRLLPVKDYFSSYVEEELATLAESFYVVESVIDLLTCKLRLSQLTTPTSIPLDNDIHYSSRQSNGRSRSCFELLTPSASIILSAAVSPVNGRKTDDQNEYSNVDCIFNTTKFEDAISNALFTAHSFTGGLDDFNQEWLHQVVLGTLHHYVITGNDRLLKDAIANALNSQKMNDIDADEVDRLDSYIIDARDGSWKTPLHYACEKGRNSAVNILIKAGANCAITTLEAESPLHICAKKLDDKSLSTILSATYPYRPDPNILDSQGRTPMYLAAMQGHDPPALSRCLSALSAWGGQLTGGNESSERQNQPHPIRFLSWRWRYEELAAILSYSNYQFPLLDSELGETSLGAKFGYPIHTALLSFREQMFSSFSMTKGDIFFEPALMRTIQTLLDSGFEPNERFEGRFGEVDIFGFTPLQILVAMVKELRSIEIKNKESVGNSETTRLYNQIMETIQSCADILVRNGARTNMPPPPRTRLDRETPSVCFSLQDALNTHTSALTPLTINHKDIHIQGDDISITLFGGRDRGKSSRKKFAALTNTEGTVFITIQTQLSSVQDSIAPGGSDSNSCAICWSEFGVISNRKQFCQVTTRFICNDCSTKRIVHEGREIRVSDGQFLFATATTKKRSTRNFLKQHKEKSDVTNQESRARTSLGLKRFGGLSGTSTKSEDKTNSSVNDKASALVSNLNQTKNAFLERGDKLQGLADKTEALSQASLDFAQLAKELNKKQSSFW